eukprot:Nk52_evm157s226 gene=Nk52_evmTU157s226
METRGEGVERGDAFGIASLSEVEIIQQLKESQARYKALTNRLKELRGKRQRRKQKRLISEAVALEVERNQKEEKEGFEEEKRDEEEKEEEEEGEQQEQREGSFKIRAIGYITSCFKTLNGSPRQGVVCPESRGILKVHWGADSKSSLEGLSDFSHCWLYFMFHLNRNETVKNKVAPPRLNGQKVGLFATRSPHRPNAIGQTLCAIERVENDVLYVKGIDLVQGTPIVDVKPYIPGYDVIDSTEWDVRVPDYVTSTGIEMADQVFDVVFEEGARRKAELLIHGGYEEDNSGNDVVDENKKMEGDKKTTGLETGKGNDYLMTATKRIATTVRNFCEFEKIVETVLRNEPRSLYRRMKCADDIYWVNIDGIDLGCLFVTHSDERKGAEVAEAGVKGEQIGQRGKVFVKYATPALKK